MAEAKIGLSWGITEEELKRLSEGKRAEPTPAQQRGALEEFSDGVVADHRGDDVLEALRPLPAKRAATLQSALQEGSDVMNVRFVGLVAKHRALSEAELANVRGVVQRLVGRWRPYPFSTAAKKALTRLPNFMASILARLPDDLVAELTKDFGDQPRRWRFQRRWKKLPDGRIAICRFLDLPLSQAIRALRSLAVKVNEQAILTAARFSLPATPPAEIDQEINSDGADRLAHLLDRAVLSPLERELLEVLRGNGMNHRQAAQDLGISWDAERVRFFRLKAKLLRAA